MHVGAHMQVVADRNTTSTPLPFLLFFCYVQLSNESSALLTARRILRTEGAMRMFRHCHAQQ